jgi:2-oxoglutarate dehydrogenase E1 component
MKADWESRLAGNSIGMIEALYALYLEDPSAVDPDWRAYFEEVPSDGVRPTDLGGPQLAPPALFRAGGSASTSSAQDSELAVRQDKVDQLIRSYRVRGHRVADLDPLGLNSEHHPELDIGHYDLSEVDLKNTFSTRTLAGVL